jgi:hypothetical protein
MGDSIFETFVLLLLLLSSLDGLGRGGDSKQGEMRTLAPSSTIIRWPGLME